jgi:hypothetical protein
MTLGGMPCATRISLRWEKKADVFTLQKIAGHGNIATTMRYVHPQHDAIPLAVRTRLRRNSQGKYALDFSLSGVTAESSEIVIQGLTIHTRTHTVNSGPRSWLYVVDDKEREWRNWQTHQT